MTMLSVVWNWTTWLSTLTICLCGAAPGTAQDTFAIASGEYSGVYYPAASAICRVFNRRVTQGPKCEALATDGSTANLSALRGAEVPFAIVQSDLHRDALRGTGPYSESEPFTGLRSVMSLHSEALILLVGQDSGIRKFDDLKRKSVSIGPSGSGTARVMTMLFERNDWTAPDLAAVGMLPIAEHGDALCSGRFDAVAFIVGNPSGEVQKGLNGCETRIVAIKASDMSDTFAAHSDYSYVTIPAGSYAALDADLTTLGVRATLVTRVDVSNELVGQLAQAVLDSLDVVAGSHPALTSLSTDTVAARGLSAPLHPAARQLYEATQLIESFAE